MTILLPLASRRTLWQACPIPSCAALIPLVGDDKPDRGCSIKGCAGKMDPAAWTDVEAAEERRAHVLAGRATEG